MSKARVEFDYGDSIARVTIDAPKANILDRDMVTSLDEAEEGIRAFLEKRPASWSTKEAAV